MCSVSAWASTTVAGPHVLVFVSVSAWRDLKSHIKVYATSATNNFCIPFWTSLKRIAHLPATVLSFSSTLAASARRMNTAPQASAILLRYEIFDVD